MHDKVLDYVLQTKIITIILYQGLEIEMLNRTHEEKINQLQSEASDEKILLNEEISSKVSRF